MKRNFLQETPLVFVILVLLGALLMSLAETPLFKQYQEILKEFGIVLFSVFGVSLIYEIRVAEMHFAKFQKMLSEKIEQGEATAAACARLGIRTIFDNRESYERSYSVTEIASKASTDSHLRFVGRSLLLLIAKNDSIKTALRQGATVEMCALDPLVSKQVLENIPDGANTKDIEAALLRFEELKTFVETEKPRGTLVFRQHTTSLFDSYALFKISDSDHFCIWDISFGFDIRKKRILLADPVKGFGADLDARYGKVWEKAIEYYRYSPKRPPGDVKAP